MGDYTYFLADALARIGNDVDVLTSEGDLDETLYPLGPRVQVHRAIKSWGLRGLPAVLRTVRALGADVVMIQYTPHAFDRRGITLAVNLLPSLLRVTGRTRVVTNFHELYIPFDRSLKHCLGAIWQRVVAFIIAASSHTLLAISSEWPRRLRRIGVWKPIQVIPVGSNIPRSQVSVEERRVIRHRLGVDQHTLLVGGLGSAGPDRDIELLIAALQELRHERPVKLVWLGKSGFGAEKWRSLQQAIQTTKPSLAIIWTGMLPHPEVSRMMAACDLFVLPFTDGVSTKRGTLPAALLHELPVLTTRGIRVDDVFVHRQNMYLVPVGEAQAFTNGLLELARCPELRLNMAQGALALHDAHFAWDVIARQVAGLTENGPRC